MYRIIFIDESEKKDFNIYLYNVILYFNIFFPLIFYLRKSNVICTNYKNINNEINILH